MKINLIKKKREDLDKNTVNIKIEFLDNNQELNQLINYINKYENKSIYVQDNLSLKEISYKDIIMFFSENKYNYCQTATHTYKIKSKLYEVENMSTNFMRISKNCIINIDHIKNFDMSKTGKIKINLDNNTFRFVSKRRITDVLYFLEERMI